MKWWETAIIASFACFLGYLAGQAKQHQRTAFYKNRLQALASSSARHWHTFHPEYDDMHWKFSDLAADLSVAPE